MMTLCFNETNVIRKRSELNGCLYFNLEITSDVIHTFYIMIYEANIWDIVILVCLLNKVTSQSKRNSKNTRISPSPHLGNGPTTDSKKNS